MPLGLRQAQLFGVTKDRFVLEMATMLKQPWPQSREAQSGADPARIIPGIPLRPRQA